MGWQSDDGRHEGWTAAVWADGRISVGSGGDGKGGRGALVRASSPDGVLDRSGEPAVADGRDAIGWLVICECGWRGPLWERVHERAEHDPDAHQIYDAEDRVQFNGRAVDVRVFGDAPPVVEDLAFAKWREHLDPPALTAVREATAAVRAAQGRLDAAVREARGDGRPWGDIGEAAGMTRQSAHERWGRTRT